MYYSNFLRANKSPKEKWWSHKQALVESQFENSPLYFTDIEIEENFGSLDFTPIEARINTIVDAKSGQRTTEDYKKIIFKDIYKKVVYGTRFFFDNNVWLTYNADNIKSEVNSIYVRRCNNTYNKQLKDGTIHREPCVIDYKVTETQLYKNSSIDIPQTRVFVQMQLNNFTKNIAINDRFIAGGEVYKIRSFHRYDRRQTFVEESVGVVSFYADLDTAMDSDNFELGVANYVCYNEDITSPLKDEIRISPNTNKILNGETVSYNVESYKNNNKVVGSYEYYLSGANSDTYIFEKTENGFNLTSVKFSKDSLKISCQDTINNLLSVINIEIGGLF